MNTIEMLNIISKDTSVFAYRKSHSRYKFFFCEIIDARGKISILPFQQMEGNLPEEMFISSSEMKSTNWIIEKKKTEITLKSNLVLESVETENEKG